MCKSRTYFFEANWKRFNIRVDVSLFFGIAGRLMIGSGTGILQNLFFELKWKRFYSGRFRIF
jgi:hypothetical protein